MNFRASNRSAARETFVYIRFRRNLFQKFQFSRQNKSRFEIFEKTCKMAEKGDVQSGINELHLALANKRNELKRIQNQIQEYQDNLNKLVEPKLERVTIDHQSKSGKVAEYESLVKSKENYRSQIMSEHSETLSKLKVSSFQKSNCSDFDHISCQN